MNSNQLKKVLYLLLSYFIILILIKFLLGYSILLETIIFVILTLVSIIILSETFIKSNQDNTTFKEKYINNIYSPICYSDMDCSNSENYDCYNNKCSCKTGYYLDEYGKCNETSSNTNFINSLCYLPDTYKAGCYLNVFTLSKYIIAISTTCFLLFDGYKWNEIISPINTIIKGSNLPIGFNPYIAHDTGQCKYGIIDNLPINNGSICNDGDKIYVFICSGDKSILSKYIKTDEYNKSNLYIYNVKDQNLNSINIDLGKGENGYVSNYTYTYIVNNILYIFGASAIDNTSSKTPIYYYYNNIYKYDFNTNKLLTPIPLSNNDIISFTSQTSIFYDDKNNNLILTFIGNNSRVANEMIILTYNILTDKISFINIKDFLPVSKPNISLQCNFYPSSKNKDKGNSKYNLINEQQNGIFKDGKIFIFSCDFFGSCDIYSNPPKITNYTIKPYIEGFNPIMNICSVFTINDLKFMTMTTGEIYKIKINDDNTIELIPCSPVSIYSSSLFFKNLF